MNTAFLFIAVMLLAVSIACGSDVQPTTEPLTPIPETADSAPATEMQPMELPTTFESATFDGLGDTTGFFRHNVCSWRFRH